MRASERGREESLLPQIWDNGFHADRIDWYTNLCIEQGDVRGGCMVIPEFIAAMTCESNLDNLRLGENHKNGTSPDSLGWSSVGYTWVQLDTQYNPPMGTLDTFNLFRSDPMLVLDWITDPANGLCEQTRTRTKFHKQLWHAWEDHIIDPEEGWSPLEAAIESYHRLT